MTKLQISLFTGGFQIKQKEVIEFIPYLFWLMRCNASLPYFFFSFPKSKTVISIFKDGALHIECYSQTEKFEILKVLKDMEFKTTDDCQPVVEFDNFEGRKIKTCP